MKTFEALHGAEAGAVVDVTGAGLRRLLSRGRPVITLSPEGLYDRRRQHAPIRWSSLDRLESGPLPRRGFHQLIFGARYPDDVRGRVRPLARLRARYSGVDDAVLSISVRGLALEYQGLLDLVIAYGVANDAPFVVRSPD